MANRNWEEVEFKLAVKYSIDLNKFYLGSMKYENDPEGNSFDAVFYNQADRYAFEIHNEEIK